MSPAATAAPPVQQIRRTQLDRLAGRLAGFAAAVGILAGAVDVAAGSSIRGWIGNKLNPTPLGLLTIVLSAVALAAAIRWMRPGERQGDRRLATALAFLIPGMICFTTIGRLWYLPGFLLLVAALLVVGASARTELSHALSRHHWYNGLTALLGAYYFFLGGDALPQAVGALGLLGALVIWTALLDRRRSHRVKLMMLAVGALPFAIVTWWSVITPVIALLVLALGPAAIGSERAAPDRGRSEARSIRGHDAVDLT